MMLTANDKKLLQEAIDLTIKSIISENVGITSAFAKAFAEKDKKSIENAVSAALKSGLSRSQLDDVLRSFTEKAQNHDEALHVAEMIALSLEDPESWSAFGKVSQREKEIGKLNI